MSSTVSSSADSPHNQSDLPSPLPTPAHPTDAHPNPAAPNTAPDAGPVPTLQGHVAVPKQEEGEIFASTTTFADLGLRNSVLKGVDAAGFKHPTSIQAALIPPVLRGRDVLGQAKTGTGKTAAFGLPLLHVCNRETPFQALVLAPTRELAIQITDEINELGQFTPIRAITLYGGQAVRSQAKQLSQGAEIVVGTPGRVMDMVERGHFSYANLRTVVLDEVDRMLDIGFREDIRRILEACPPGRQTVFVSATISPDIEKLARRYLKDPEKIVVKAGSLTVSLVKQYHLPVNAWDKPRLLKHLLKHEEPGLTVVFCRLKRTVDELASMLQRAGIDAHAIHGDMSQGKRNKTMQTLRSGSLSVLIASDLASRGIDVEGISHVVNYDLPDDVELYVHRIGRTARAGRGGVAWAFVTPEQGGLLTDIEMLINAEIPKLDYPDFTPTPPPPGYRGEIPRQYRIAAAQGGQGGPGGGGGDPNAPAAPEPKIDRYAQASNPTLPQAADKVDATKFPGGIVPTKLPPKRMGGRVSTGRK
jgi:ATP-dependent RNA helicase DeaD